MEIFSLIDRIIPAVHRHLLKMSIAQCIKLQYYDICKLSPLQKKNFQETIPNWVDIILEGLLDKAMDSHPDTLH